MSTTIIEELQKQIKLLQEQVAGLTVQLEASKKEVTATRGELRSTQQEVKGIKEEIRFTRLLQRGVSGDEVKKLQEFLARFPDIYPEARVTGYFGPKTEAAVKRLQEKQGIEVIGIVGPKTLAKLNELITEGAGESGVSPPGLSRSPGLQKENVPGIPSTPPVTPSGTTPAIPAEPGAQTGTTTVPAIPAVPRQPTIVATSTEPVPTPVPSPSPAPTPAPMPTPTPAPTPSPAPSPSPTPTPTPSSGATSTPITSSTNSNNNSLLSFARVDSDRYVLSFSDPDGLRDIDIRKAGGSVLYSGHPFNCPTQLEGASGGWLNFKFLPSDFPLTGSIVDCAHSGVAYPVQVSLPPLLGPSPVSAQNSQVQGVSATVSADRAVLVSWTPVPIGVSVYGIYNIYRGASADFIPNVQTNRIAQVNNTVYQDAQVPDGVYYYKVALQDINGVVGLASVAVKAVVTTLSQVQGLTAIVAGSSVNLSWQDVSGIYSLSSLISSQSTSMFGSYNIYRGSSADFIPSRIPGNPNLIVQGSVLSYTDANLSAGTYYYKITLQDKNGLEGPASAAVSAVIAAAPATIPADPSGVTSAGYNASNASVSLRWTDNSSNETYFEIYRRPGGQPNGPVGAWIILNQVGSNVTSYTDMITTPSPYGSYEYRVGACNTAGCASNSGTVAILIPSSTATTTTGLIGNQNAFAALLASLSALSKILGDLQKIIQ